MEQLILRLGVALSVGLLVGLERGWRERDEPAGSRTAGIRTYGISGLLGGIFAALSAAFNAPYVFAAGFAGFALLFGWFQAHEAEHENKFSVTSTVAGLSVFALGGLAVSGDYRIAAAGGAVLAGMLASRELLHGLLRKLSWIELRSALVLAVMTAVVLPLLPNRAIDPWGGLNPQQIWLFTILTAGISYMGYVASRLVGPSRGYLVSGLAGALVSSTAVTVAFARTAKSSGSNLPLAGAAALAAMVSVIRVIVIVLILEPEVVQFMGPPALASSLTLGICGLILLTHDRAARDSVTLPRNPFDLLPLLLFAAGFAAVSTASAALVPQFGSASLLATSGFSAIFDVDVAVLSAVRLVDHAIEVTLVGQAVLVALFANALGRLSLAAFAGPPAYTLALAAVTLMAVATGVGVFVLTANTW